MNFIREGIEMRIKTSLLLCVTLLPLILSAQQRPRRITLRQPGGTAADTTFTVNATGNDTSDTYIVWPTMTVFYNVSSSGTVEFNLLFQTAAIDEYGNLTGFVTDVTVAVSATGWGRTTITDSPISNYPARYRVIFDGQGANDASTTVVAVLNGSNPYRR